MYQESKEEIFIKAFGQYEKSLLVRSYFKVSDRDLSDDLVQTTFLRTWQYLVKSGKIDSMKAFLFHILNDLIIDEYRKKKLLSLDILTEKGLQFATEDSDRLFNIMDGKTAIVLIPLLDKKYCKIMNMRYVGEMTLKEISKNTGQSNNTVAVQIHRGTKKLAILFSTDNK